MFLVKALEEAGGCILRRGVIAINGQDSPKFLQGMCTSDIFRWNTNPNVKGVYAIFLNAHVRLSHLSS